MFIVAGTRCGDSEGIAGRDNASSGPAVMKASAWPSESARLLKVTLREPSGDAAAAAARRIEVRILVKYMMVAVPRFVVDVQRRDEVWRSRYTTPGTSLDMYTSTSAINVTNIRRVSYYCCRGSAVPCGEVREHTKDASDCFRCASRPIMGTSYALTSMVLGKR